MSSCSNKPFFVIHPLLIVFLLLLCKLIPSSSTNFAYNRFTTDGVIISDGVAQVTSNGLLQLTNNTENRAGHAFYSNPILFKPTPTSSNGSLFSFSTSFIFGIQPDAGRYNLSGHGIMFVITQTPALLLSLPAQYLGVFDLKNTGVASNRIFGVELDTVRSLEFLDINNNHVGIDINSPISNISAPASYFPNNNNGSSYKNLTLASGEPMRVWVEYNGTEMKTTVTIAPLHIEKPQIPLLTLRRDLSQVFNDYMYVGFSSATGLFKGSHYIHAWSFAINGSAPEIDVSKLSKLPPITSSKLPPKLDVPPTNSSKQVHIMMGGARLRIIISVVAVVVAVLMIIAFGAFYYHHHHHLSKFPEDWESDYGPHQFRYKDLYLATKGFKDDKHHLLGTGGFGQVYKGIISSPNSKNSINVAVKKIAHQSRQGVREFVAEIVSIGKLRHRNLVQLLGYCRHRKGELLLVYDYMPNGSLDKYLHVNADVHWKLNWTQRFKIIKGVASGLLYLHEEWEQVVIHRDVKPGNVLLDADFNPRLGDFGLARLHDHGTDPQTSHVAGTWGYLAPEHARSGKATKSTDVFAFGVFLLEVLCGRKPIPGRENENESEEIVLLVDWVLERWRRGEMLTVVDPRLEGEFDEEEVAMIV